MNTENDSLHKSDEISIEMLRNDMHEQMLRVANAHGIPHAAEMSDPSLHYVLSIFDHTAEMQAPLVELVRGVPLEKTDDQKRLRGTMIGLLTEIGIAPHDILEHRSDAVMHLALVFLETKNPVVAAVILGPDGINMEATTMLAGMCEIPQGWQSKNT